MCTHWLWGHQGYTRKWFPISDNQRYILIRNLWTYSFGSRAISVYSCGLKESKSQNLTSFSCLVKFMWKGARYEKIRWLVATRKKKWSLVALRVLSIFRQEDAVFCTYFCINTLKPTWKGWSPWEKWSHW